MKPCQVDGKLQPGQIADVRIPHLQGGQSRHFSAGDRHITFLAQGPRNRRPQVGIGNVHLRVRVGGFARRLESRRYDQFHRGHTCSDAKGRIHIGSQPAARDAQPIHFASLSSKPIAIRLIRQTRSHPRRRDAGLPVNQYHPAALVLHTHRHPVDIHPRPHGAANRIRRVPRRRMKASRPLPIHQRLNALAQEVKHL